MSRYKSKEQKWRMMCPGTHRRCHCSRKPVSVSGGITGFGEIRTNTSVVRGRQTRALNREEIHPWTTRKQITSDRPGVQRTRTVGFYYFPFHPWNEITSRPVYRETLNNPDPENAFPRPSAKKRKKKNLSRSSET